jgi:hypothetical protein
LTAGTVGGRPTRQEEIARKIRSEIADGAQLVLVQARPFAYARLTPSGGVVSLYLPDQEMLVNEGERLVPLFKPWHDTGLV